MVTNRHGDSFVHVLLFECAQCRWPVPSAVTSEARNIEDVDARVLDLHCSNCGWSGALEGARARRHWVDEWNAAGETWLPNIGRVVDRISPQTGLPMIVHNIGRGPKLEDVLFNWKITGHYRYFGPASQ